MLSSALFMAGGKKNDAWDTKLESNAELFGAKLLSAMYWKVSAFLQGKLAKNTEALLVYGANKNSVRQLNYIFCLLQMQMDIFHNYNETRATSEHWLLREELLKILTIGNVFPDQH